MSRIEDVTSIVADSFHSEEQGRTMFRCIVRFKKGNDYIGFFSSFTNALKAQSKFNEKWEKYLNEQYAKQED